MLCENIRQGLHQARSRQTPRLTAANAEAYRAHCAARFAKLHAKPVGDPPRAAVLATCEGAFSYSGRGLGLEAKALPLAVNAESQVTPKRMARLIALCLREREVPRLFCESIGERRKPQRQVAKEKRRPFRRGVLRGVAFSRRWPGPIPAGNLQRSQCEGTLLDGLSGELSMKRS